MVASMLTQKKQQTLVLAALTLAVIAAPSFLSARAFLSYQDAAGRAAQAEKLTGDIIYLDEVLTMSARMAAATGEHKWTERYNAHVDTLTDAITDWLTLAGSPSVGAMGPCHR